MTQETTCFAHPSAVGLAASQSPHPRNQKQREAVSTLPKDSELGLSAGVGPDLFAGVRGRTKPYPRHSMGLPYMPGQWGGSPMAVPLVVPGYLFEGLGWSCSNVHHARTTSQAPDMSPIRGGQLQALPEPAELSKGVLRKCRGQRLPPVLGAWCVCVCSLQLQWLLANLLRRWDGGRVPGGSNHRT